MATQQPQPQPHTTLRTLDQLANAIQEEDFNTAALAAARLLPSPLLAHTTILRDSTSSSSSRKKKHAASSSDNNNNNNTTTTLHATSDIAIVLETLVVAQLMNAQYEPALQVLRNALGHTHTKATTHDHKKKAKHHKDQHPRTPAADQDQNLILANTLKQNTHLRFAHIYSLYKCAHFQEAAHRLQDAKAKQHSSSSSAPNTAIDAAAGQGQDQAIQLLEAQCLFSTQQFEQAAQAYLQLLSKHQKKHQQGQEEDERTPELIANVLAALVADGQYTQAIAFFNKHRPAVRNSSPVLYAVLFNAACAFIGLEDYHNAARMLTEARTRGRDAMLHDGYTEEEVAEELCGVDVQAAYLAQLQGSADDAKTAYAAVLARKSGVDKSTTATASNNLVALRNKDEQLFDSKKRIERLLAMDQTVLSSSLRHAVAKNAIVCALFKGDYDGAAKAAKEFAESLPTAGAAASGSSSSGDRDFLSRMRAYMHTHTGKRDDVLAMLDQEYQAEMKNRGETSITTEEGQKKVDTAMRILCMMAQVYLDADDLEKAISVLHRCAALGPQFEFAPGMVGTLVALYTSSRKMKKGAKMKRANADGGGADKKREADVMQDGGSVCAGLTEAFKVFENAIAYHGAQAVRGGASSDAQRASRNVWMSMLQHFADFKLSHNQVSEAVTLYEQLLAQVPADDSQRKKAVLSKLIILRGGSGGGDTSAGGAFPAVPIDGVDIDALLACTSLVGSKKNANASKRLQKQAVFADEGRLSEATASADGTLTAVACGGEVGTAVDSAREERIRERKRLKRKKRKRLPKHFDPENPGDLPDPERWLPRWERKAYKKRRAYRNRKRGGGQGQAPASPAAETHPSVAAIDAAPPSGSATAHDEQQQEQQQAAPPRPKKKKNNKKKKKGKSMY